MQMIKISRDNLTCQQVIQLLAQHHADMFNHSPPESIHALPIEQLRQPNIHFYRACVDGQLAGVGGFKLLDNSHGELKSMRTASEFLRQGIANALLIELFKQAKRLGLTRLSLETGTAAAFAPAQKLYLSHGFEYCPPFADHKEDPFSLFMTKLL